LLTVGNCLALAEVDEVGVVTCKVSIAKLCVAFGSDLRVRSRLTILLTSVKSIRLTGGLNKVLVKSQAATASTTTVLTAAILVVLSIVVLTISAVSTVSTIATSIATTVATSVTTVTTTVAAASKSSELGVGNAGCEQHRDEGREAHVVRRLG
jgi:hypothetical protein